MVHKIKLFYKCHSKDILKTLTAACEEKGDRGKRGKPRRGCLRQSSPSPPENPDQSHTPFWGLTIGRVPSILCWVAGDDVFMIWLCLLAGKVADKVVCPGTCYMHGCSGVLLLYMYYIYKGSDSPGASALCRVNYVENVKQKRLK